jgi:activator of HSP90 ATPase
MKRNFILCALVTISTVVIGRFGSVRRIEATASGPQSSSTSIHQEIDYKASPQQIYDALLDSKQFAAFTGLPAEIHREVGGAFTCFEGQIAGRNVELIPDKRIVQAWRSNSWPAGTYSIAKFELTEQGQGTRVVMDHTGFPEGSKESLEAGWKSHYWGPLQKYLAQQH